MTVTQQPAKTYTRSTSDVGAGLARQVKAFGRRLGTGDPHELAQLQMLQQDLNEAFAAAVAGLRACGFSDGDIGRELGVTGQAVNKRWPRPR